MFLLLIVNSTFLLSHPAQAIEKPTIDLNKGTFNGRVFLTLTIANITTLLGKPSQQSKGTVGGIVHTDIYYQDMGLLFQVTSDTNTCHMLLIDMTGKALDEMATHEKVNNVHGKKYSGSISPNIDGTWKLQSVKAQFKDNNLSVNERDKSVVVQFSNYGVIFSFDKATELLDGIILMSNTPIKYKK